MLANARSPRRGREPGPCRRPDLGAQPGLSRNTVRRATGADVGLIELDGGRGLKLVNRSAHRSVGASRFDKG